MSEPCLSGYYAWSKRAPGDPDADHLRFRAFASTVYRGPYFAGSSLILSPAFATGITQIGVATSAELSSDV